MAFPPPPAASGENAFTSPEWQNWFYMIYTTLNGKGAGAFNSLSTSRGTMDSIATGPVYRPVKSINTDYSMLSTDVVLMVDADLNDVAVTLPLASFEGGKKSSRLTIRRIDSSIQVLTVVAKDNNNVDGGTTMLIGAAKSYDFESDGNLNWYTVGVN